MSCNVRRSRRRPNLRNLKDPLRMKTVMLNKKCVGLLSIMVFLSLTAFGRSTPAVSSTGNTLYVSPSGSDSNPCTQTSPCATPDHAEGVASPGDTVQVAAGTYDYGT